MSGGGPGTSYRFLRHRFVKVRGILKKFNTFEVVGHLALPEVGAVLVTPDGLDLNLPGTGKAVLPAHHYKAMLDEDQEMAYTFQAGIDLGAYGGVIGSFVYENNGKMEYVMVEDGTVDITLDGSTYTVDAVVKSGGKEYKFRYTGAIEVETYTDGGDGGWTTVNVGKLTQARFEYYGDEYGTNGVSDNWILYLYDDGVSIGNDGFTDVGDIMRIELDCPVGVKDHIEPGTSLPNTVKM